MCLAVPMKVIELTPPYARVEMDGISARVGLHLLDDVNIGDYVLIHAGYAIEKLNPDIAEETIGYFREMAQGNSGEKAS